MKKLITLGMAAALVGLAFSPSAFAGIVGSRHDMANATNPYATLAGFAGYGACAACHIPHGAVGARLFPNVPVGAAGGFFGPLCQTCHDTSIVAGQVNLNTNATVFGGGSGSHGFSISAINQAGSHQTIATSGLPYVTGNAPSGSTNIECLSCHDVHNQNGFRPFLQVTLDNLCEACHSNRINNNTTSVGWANNAGTSGATHPAGPVFTGDVSGIATAPNSPIYNLATELVQNVDQAPNGSTWAAGELPWNSGLQLSGQGAFGTGGVDCISCHNVHWDENDATPYNGTSYLADVDDGGGTTMNNTFCEYCHRGQNVAASTGGFYWNPGNTNFSHPNDDVSGGNATILAINMTWQPGSTMPQDGTGSSTLICTSCHGIHPSNATVPKTQTNTPLLWDYAGTNVCVACHGAGGAASYTSWNHHPVGASVYATAGNNAGGVSCAGGDLAPGLNACHGSGGGTANGGWMAHNRSSALGNPGTGNSGTCMNCHTNNPSTYTLSTPYTAAGAAGNPATARASHFVGDASVSGISRTTDDGAGGIRVAGGASANWTGSGLPSLFGSTTDTMICESCHRLAAGNIVSGDGATGLLVEVSGSAINIVASTVTGAGAYTGAPYICTGCHLVPGGTHPLADAVGSSYAIPGGGVAAGQSYTANTTANCESCHSPHDAATDSGSYILDGGSATTYGSGTGMQVEPVIDYTSFCAVCHGAFD